MKLLVLVAVLAVAYLVWRAQRTRTLGPGRPPAAGSRPGQPQDMVRCPVCQVHVPRGDAVPDPQGRLYCCPEHRDSART